MPLSLFVFALVQGTTEFLPVSSSGHLWWFSLLLGEDGEPYFVTSILHVVTATAAVASYRRLYWSAASGIVSGGRSHSFALRYLAALGVSGAVAAPLGPGPLVAIHPPHRQQRMDRWNLHAAQRPGALCGAPR